MKKEKKKTRQDRKRESYLMDRELNLAAKPSFVEVPKSYYAADVSGTDFSVYNLSLSINEFGEFLECARNVFKIKRRETTPLLVTQEQYEATEFGLEHNEIVLAWPINLMTDLDPATKHRAIGFGPEDKYVILFPDIYVENATKAGHYISFVIFNVRVDSFAKDFDNAQKDVAMVMMAFHPDILPKVNDAFEQEYRLDPQSLDLKKVVSMFLAANEKAGAPKTIRINQEDDLDIRATLDKLNTILTKKGNIQHDTQHDATPVQREASDSNGSTKRTN